MAIKSIEWLGMYEAARLVVKSEWMRDEAYRLYRVPLEKVMVVPPKSSGWVRSVLEVYKDVAGGAVS
jgi:hypothetical protein